MKLSKIDLPVKSYGISEYNYQNLFSAGQLHTSFWFRVFHEFSWVFEYLRYWVLSWLVVRQLIHLFLWWQQSSSLSLKNELCMRGKVFDRGKDLYAWKGSLTCVETFFDRGKDSHVCKSSLTKQMFDNCLRVSQVWTFR